MRNANRMVESSSEGTSWETKHKWDDTIKMEIILMAQDRVRLQSFVNCIMNNLLSDVVQAEYV
jgi:ATP-dependent Clp protease adapter protein ClpS